jgi:hypothetical protein
MKSYFFLPVFSIFALGCNSGTPAPANNTNSNTSVSVPAAPIEATYKLIVPINDLQPEKGVSPEDMGETASDVGFYMMGVEDDLKAKGYQITEYNFVRDSIKIVDKSNKLVKYISVKTQMKTECCGFVLAQTGREPKFIPVDAVTENTVKAAEAYFK